MRHYYIVISRVKKREGKEADDKVQWLHEGFSAQAQLFVAFGQNEYFQIVAKNNNALAEAAVNSHRRILIPLIAASMLWCRKQGEH